MKKNYKPFVALLLLAAILAGAWLLYGNLTRDTEGESAKETLAASSAGETDGEGKDSGSVKDLGPAADFTVYDADGEAHRLADYVGKPIVLNFWASWCGPCRQEMPYFNDAFVEHGDDIAFLMVNATDGTRETIETAQSFIDENDYLFPVYFDREGSACNAYQITGFPTTWFIDAEGRVTGYHIGSMSDQELKTSIDGLLSE